MGGGGEGGGSEGGGGDGDGGGGEGEGGGGDGGGANGTGGDVGGGVEGDGGGTAGGGGVTQGLRQTKGWVAATSASIHCPESVAVEVTIMRAASWLVVPPAPPGSPVFQLV